MGYPSRLYKKISKTFKTKANSILLLFPLLFVVQRTFNPRTTWSCIYGTKLLKGEWTLFIKISLRNGKKKKF